ncbi:sodium-dependent nutrient amino acid transporter 1-like [Drosophila bipectinata]|uniref:sodium-dependent nutrient amino acid transporter 1-like n=1 Tax=Drosophila bipectinata TaxID=42026 RepID=UPI001C89E4B8|nr:sodium-dependent nutrient amino acid transporter 1-like [Drosophila bipectinata]
MDDAEYQKLSCNVEGSRQEQSGSGTAVIYTSAGEELTINCDIVHEMESQTSTQRDKWGKGVEFLFSCIALSVGLGNVWRFPFIALENGGGAFLIPYVIVLLLIGRPVYYLEVIIGQFSSRGCILLKLY